MELLDRHFRALETLLRTAASAHTQIYIEDATGFLHCDPRLHSLLFPYLEHGCAWCQHVKSNPLLFNRCVLDKARVLEKVQRLGAPFTGYCHGGAAEAIYPIFHQNRVAGYISAGPFRCPSPFRSRRLRHIARTSGWQPASEEKLYEAQLPERLPPALLSLCETLALLLSYIITEKQMDPPVRYTQHSAHRDLVIRITDYIHTRYFTKISLDDIARFCNCSKSHIQHIFKKYYKMSILSYLEKIRMEKARVLLVHTDMLVYQIARHVGYLNVSYFINSFRQSYDLSPTAYRQAYRQEA